ncbi:MAG: hypothetical protein ACE5JJ_09040 [Nitrospinota bacterium]
MALLDLVLLAVMLLVLLDSIEGAKARPLGSGPEAEPRRGVMVWLRVGLFACCASLIAARLIVSFFIE